MSAATIPRSWTFSTALLSDGSRLSEAVLQPDDANHGRLVAVATACGFTECGEEDAPATSATLEVLGGCVTGLVLPAGGVRLGPDRPLPVSAAWLMAAQVSRHAIVMVVPPGTWPEDGPVSAELVDGPEQLEAYRDVLDQVQAERRMMWGLVAVTLA